MNLQPGFIPALGTPLDGDGHLVSAGLITQIEQQLSAGCVAVLSMGSMGQQAFLRGSECPKVARLTAETVNGRVPVFVGAMDNSIARAKERLAAMEDLPVDGFVLTTPYYHASTAEQAMNYFKAVAAATAHKVLLYDLPGVTQTKITYEMVLRMRDEIPNLSGIKSADLQLFRKLRLNRDVPDDFSLIYSGLDTFDITYQWGITNNLDGMIDCTPVNFSNMYKAMAAGDYDTAAVCLSNVVRLRDFFVTKDLWRAFSVAMNLIGCEGDFAPDYISPPCTPALREDVRQALLAIGEL